MKLETDIPPDLWVVEVDASEFQLALLNLCFNGRDAMSDGGTLRISATNRVVENDRPGLSGRYVAIDIADNGGGDPARTAAPGLRAVYDDKGGWGWDLGNRN